MRKNYVYAIKDLDELHQAVAQWYQRRYQVNLNPDREITLAFGIAGRAGSYLSVHCGSGRYGSGPGSLLSGFRRRSQDRRSKAGFICR